MEIKIYYNDRKFKLMWEIDTLKSTQNMKSVSLLKFYNFRALFHIMGWILQFSTLVSKNGPLLARKQHLFVSIFDQKTRMAKHIIKTTIYIASWVISPWSI
jgi:hypothetical protein